jgi:hypothetical protein
VNYLKALFHSDDSQVDSLIFGGLTAIAALIGLQVYTTIIRPQDFSPVNFGGAVTAILGGIGGGRRLRDGLCQGDKA